MAHVGLGFGRVLTDDVQAPELASLHGLEHEGQVQPRFGVDGGSPDGLEPCPGVGIHYVGEAGKLVRQRTHVATTLDVVLAPERHETRPPPPDVPGEQRQVAQCQHVVDGVVVLGDPERPHDLGFLGAAVGVSELADGGRRDTGDLLDPVERVGVDRLRIGVVAGGGPVDEPPVGQPRRDDLASDRVGEGDVGADVEPQPGVRELGGRRPARVDTEQARPALDTLQEMMEEDRMSLAGIRTPEDRYIDLLGLSVGTRPSAGSEDRRQTDDRRCVSRSITGVDVVRPQRHAGELLGGVVDLVGRLRAAEHADAARAVSFDDRAQRRGRAVEGLIPGRRPKPPVVADERFGEARARHPASVPAAVRPHRRGPSLRRR